MVQSVKILMSVTKMFIIVQRTPSAVIRLVVSHAHVKKDTMKRASNVLKTKMNVRQVLIIVGTTLSVTTQWDHSSVYAIPVT